MRKWLLLIGGGLVALLIIVAGFSAFTAQLETRHQKQAANNFVHYVLTGDHQASYAMFSSVAQKAQSQSSWTASVKKVSTFFKGKTPSFQKLTATKDAATVTYTISGSDGDYTMTVTLAKTKAGWQVLTFTSQLTVT